MSMRCTWCHTILWSGDYAVSYVQQCRSILKSHWPTEKMENAIPGRSNACSLTFAIGTYKYINECNSTSRSKVKERTCTGLDLFFSFSFTSNSIVGEKYSMRECLCMCVLANFTCVPCVFSQFS